MNLWASKEDIVGITADLQGNPWNIAGTLPASARPRFAHARTYYYSTTSGTTSATCRSW